MPNPLTDLDAEVKKLIADTPNQEAEFLSRSGMAAALAEVRKYDDAERGLSKLRANLGVSDPGTTVPPELLAQLRTELGAGTDVTDVEVMSQAIMAVQTVKSYDGALKVKNEKGLFHPEMRELRIKGLVDNMAKPAPAPATAPPAASVGTFAPPTLPASTPPAATPSTEPVWTRLNKALNRR